MAFCNGETPFYTCNGCMGCFGDANPYVPKFNFWPGRAPNHVVGGLPVDWEIAFDPWDDFDEPYLLCLEVNTIMVVQWFTTNKYIFLGKPMLMSLP